MKSDPRGCAEIEGLPRNARVTLGTAVVPEPGFVRIDPRAPLSTLKRAFAPALNQVTTNAADARVNGHAYDPDPSPTKAPAYAPAFRSRSSSSFPSEGAGLAAGADEACVLAPGGGAGAIAGGGVEVRAISVSSSATYARAISNNSG